MKMTPSTSENSSNFEKNAAGSYCFCSSSNILRSQLIITKLEQKVNEQQVEIFKLKKKIKKLTSLPFKTTIKSQDKPAYKLSLSEEKLSIKGRKNSCPDETSDLDKKNQKETLLLETDNVKDNLMANLKTIPIEPKKRRPPSLIVKQLDVVNPATSYEAIEEFAQDVKAQSPQTFKDIKDFLHKKEGGPPISGEIYNFIDKTADSLSKIKGISLKYKDEEKVKFLVEDLVFEILYPQIFNVEEELIAKSLEIREKFFVLQNVVTPELLEIPEGCIVPSIFLHLQNEIKKINERKSPINKLKVIGNCFDNLISLYESTHKSKKPSADDLFPSIIYLILNANPDNLSATIDYIYKYVRQEYLIGEYGYLITNVTAAISFLESLDGNALNNGKLSIKPKKTIP